MENLKSNKTKYPQKFVEGDAVCFVNNNHEFERGIVDNVCMNGYDQWLYTLRRQDHIWLLVTEDNVYEDRLDDLTRLTEEIATKEHDMQTEIDDETEELKKRISELNIQITIAQRRITGLAMREIQPLQERLDSMRGDPVNYAAEDYQRKMDNRERSGYY